MSHLSKAKELLTDKGRQQIVITMHVKPDGDALGSSMALKHFLELLEHEVHVVSPTDYARYYDWLPGIDDMLIYPQAAEKCNELTAHCNLVFCLDFNALSRIGDFAPAVRDTPAQRILIDHHLEPEPNFEMVFSDTSASSTCEMIYRFINDMGLNNLISQPIAECMYTGLITDTGGFQYSMSAAVHEMAADLVRKGVNSNELQNKIFNVYTRDRMQFWGYALNECLHFHDTLPLAWFAIPNEVSQRFNLQNGDMEGLVNYPLRVKGIRMAALFREEPEKVKISFRSVGDVNVNLFAREHFSGGGHKNAAGGISKNNLTDTLERFKTNVGKLF